METTNLPMKTFLELRQTFLPSSLVLYASSSVAWRSSGEGGWGIFENQSATNKSLKINSPGNRLHLVWRNQGVLHKNDEKLFSFVLSRPSIPPEQELSKYFSTPLGRGGGGVGGVHVRLLTKTF